MSADALLSRLDRVRQTGPGRWIARCPAHEDKRPSLSVRELDDGRILLHCFAGCGVEETLGAVGLDFDALFPERPIEGAKRERRPFNAHDVLACIEFESLLVATAAANMRQGMPPSDADYERLMTAAERLQSAARLANGDR